MSTVAVFGGTGFVGRYVTQALADAGHTVRLLVRPGRSQAPPMPTGAQTVSGEIGDADAIRATLQGADAAVYLIGILREDPARGVTFEALQYEGAVRVIDAAREVGVSRFLLMSANGVEREENAYQRTKRAAERHLEQSGLTWTVFRPSVVFGDPRGAMEFATQLREQIVDPPIPAPLFYKGLLPTGAGRFELSPVHVEDVALAFARSVDDERFFGRTVPLGGPQALSWEEILRRIAHAAGRRHIAVPVPACAVDFAARLFERYPFFPLTRDQLAMLLEGNVAESGGVWADLGIAPKAFTEEELGYLAAERRAEKL